MTTVASLAKALRDLQPTMRAISESLAVRMRDLVPAMRAIRDLALEALRRSPSVLARRMRLNQELHDAAHFLLDAHANLVKNVDEREYPGVIHDAVGALEELACRLAGGRNGRLDGAVKVLVAKGRIKASQGERMLQAYVMRNRVRGAGHGAGSRPYEVASYVMFRVCEGILVLLDAFEIEEPAEPGATA